MTYTGTIIICAVIYALVGIGLSLRFFHHTGILSGLIMALFWPFVFLARVLLYGRCGHNAASLEGTSEYVTEIKKCATIEDWVKGWLKRETGVKFRLEHADYAAQVDDQLSRRLLPCAKFEGLGTCTCGIPAGRDIRFYLSEECFLSICPKCDSWSVFPTRAQERRERSTGSS